LSRKVQAEQEQACETVMKIGASCKKSLISRQPQYVSKSDSNKQLGLIFAISSLRERNLFRVALSM
jgi:ornithine carbamoyltransferase